jgi:hypothetical protein
VDPDTDQDGCTDSREQQIAPGSEFSGGRRDHLNFWDFFDTPSLSNVRDKAVAGTDFMRVMSRFGSTGRTSIDPLSPPPPPKAYHTAFDHGVSTGPYPWSLPGPDGAVSGTDFFAVLAQFGHSCL